MHSLVVYMIKHIPFVQFAYRLVMSAVLNAIGWFVKTEDKLVLFSSYGGRQYSDSPKVLYEAMKKDSCFAGYRFTWAFEHPEEYVGVIDNCVKMDSLSYFITALKAKVWITNVNIERGLHFKKRNTIYLNTWHGTGPKKGGNAVKGRKDYDFSYVDILICDGEYSKHEMVEWFNATERNIIMCGRPREDELYSFEAEDNARIRKTLGIPLDKKVILYMPTWREYGNLNIDWKKWHLALSNEYVVLVRYHHFAKGNKSDIQMNQFLFDGTKHKNVNELYWVSDVLISDYSSAFFDYGLLGRPMLCFAYDYEKYEQGNGLLMDLKNEFPGGIQRTEEAMIQAIQQMNYQDAAKASKEYVDGIVSHLGNATKACIEALRSKLK